MSLSSTIATAASKAIKMLGVTATFTHEEEATFDPATGISTDTTTTFTVKGVKDSFEKHEINGTTILASDVKFVIEKPSGTPEVGDTCTIGATTYRVMNVVTTDPADIVIIYEVQLRV